MVPVQGPKARRLVEVSMWKLPVADDGGVAMQQLEQKALQLKQLVIEELQSSF